MPEEIINITIEDSNEAVNITVDETTEQVNITIGETQPVKTSDLNNDGADGVHPFITLEDIPAGAVESVTGDLVDNTDPANPVINNPTLAEVLTEGNSTDGNQINLNGTDAIVLDNASTLKKGTYDFGADGGISRICGVGYEDMWQSGFRHVFDSNGLIRNTTNGFDLIPNNSFDVTLRFKVGSRWTLDNGDTYECTDATEGAAVWELVNIGIIPTLQQVTAAGNQATTDIEVNSLGLYNNDDANYGYLNWLSSSGLSFKNNTTQEVFNANKTGSSLSFINADDRIAKLDATSLTDNRNFLLQDADGTIALTTDIPDVSTLVPYTGATEDVNLGEFGLLTGNIEFDNTPTNTPTAAGSMYYNDTDGTLDLKLKGGNVTLQIGQESVIRVVNKTATNITLLEANYQAVRVTGVQGQRMKVDLSQATTDPLSAETIGLVTETIANNQEGFVTTSGLVRGINTTGSLQSETWADGDILYLSPTVAGRITKVKPTAPNHLIIIGYVIHAHITQGSIFVKVDNGYELDELHNVLISSVANNQGLIYESSSDIWKNKTIDKTLVGLANVDNTSDANKPVSTAQSTAIDAKVADAITNGVTTIAPSQNAVFDALALKENALGFTAENVTNKQTDLTASATKYPTVNAVNTGLALRQRKLFNLTPQVTHTGTTVKTIIATYFIPANTFTAGDFLIFNALVSKVANISNTTHTIEINTTNTLTGAQILSTAALNTTSFSMKFKREIVLQGGVENRVLQVNTTTPNDNIVGLTTTVLTQFTYNLAADLYFFVTCTLTNSLDTIHYRGIKITD
jgi:hypothetical protein